MESYRAKNGTVMFTKRAIPLQKPNRFMQKNDKYRSLYKQNCAKARSVIYGRHSKIKQLRKPAVPCDRCLTSQKILA